MLPLQSTDILTLASLISGHILPESIAEEQWPILINMSIGHGVGGMLLWSLRQAGWVRDSNPYIQPLVDLVRKNGRYNLLLEKNRHEIGHTFEQENISAIWLKGIAVSQTLYPYPHLRPMADIDVLVPADRLVTARKVLFALGFKPAQVDFFELGKFTDQARHHECMIDPSGRVKLDLHFRLLIPTLLSLLDDGTIDWFWTQTMEYTLSGPSFAILKPEANLMYLCAHAILQNHGEPLDLLHLLDIHLLITQSDFDWNLVLERATLLHWTDAVGQALKLVAFLFKTPLPENILSVFKQDSLNIECELLKLDYKQNTRRWVDWYSAFQRMKVLQRIRLIWLTLFPPSVFMRQQYHLTTNQILFPYYIYHFLDGGREVARALREIKRERSTSYVRK